jgi:DNA-binding HxlR family transcriptional regulator
VATNVATRGYGQYCGFARALELVGERWALLIIRDLLVGPRRFSDLRKGLPKIPSNVLADRLKELERDGVVRRRLLPRPASATVYELTNYGSQIEEAVMRLGVWGAQCLGEPKPEEIITNDSMTIALRSTFVPLYATNTRLSFELRMGEVHLLARVDDGTLEVTEAADAGSPVDLSMECGPTLKAVLAGEVSPEAAIEQGLVVVREGDPALVHLFAQLFQIPSHKEPVSV